MRKKVLFLSPICPSLTGNGLSMRAGAMVEGMSEIVDVYLLVVPIAKPDAQRIRRTVRGWCCQSEVLRFGFRDRVSGFMRTRLPALSFNGNFRKPLEWRYTSTRLVKKAFQIFGHVKFDHIHVFRIYMTPYARPYLRKNSTATRHIDLDDIESTSRSRLATLFEHNGDARACQKLRAEAKRYANIERHELPLVDRVYVCSGADKERLEKSLNLKNVSIMPNTARLPAEARPYQQEATFNFLFVGNLNFHPNRDAIEFFVLEILPLIRRHLSSRVKLTIVGPGKGKWAQALSSDDCEIVGHIRDLGQIYEDTFAVIVPIRAGSGTRIKVIEAFAHKRPVVSTTIGIEGLDVEHEREVLIADDPERFSRECMRLIEDSSLYARLVSRAHSLFHREFTQATVSERLSQLIQESA